MGRGRRKILESKVGVVIGADENLRRWLRWSQSERVAVTNSVQEELLWFPGDFLARRSPTFHFELSENHDREEQSPLILENVPFSTIREFYRWSMMENPHIRYDACFEEVDALAELAEKYKIRALGWQASDRIRQQLCSGLWQLRPQTVSSKYKYLQSDSWLFQLYRAALATVAEGLQNCTDDQMAEWRLVASEMPAIALDLFEAQSRRHGKNYLREGGSCRFHDHDDDPHPSDCTMTLGLCPFEDMGCFKIESWGF
ncbi:hypothetical protein PV05_06961 [Exophiala xenobiotica]|uniref:BTB domain-containing protein n=1 Tax=Exophiala xenobiotica TaxID=348802 RepID=A0A0D2CWR4_9EURO|nr:uncharacterized protein PV05_06961 [Exophiala xenobiotica]KIW54612.1 hypothetical protein PV05_06961 [Exophiala xenobiotica]